MSVDLKCLKEKEIKELESRVNELEREFSKAIHKIDSLDVKMDELKELMKGLMEDFSKVSDYKYKVENMCNVFVLRDDFYALKSEVDRLKERFAENDRALQRYQWWVTIVMGVVTCISLVSSFLR